MNLASCIASAMRTHLLNSSPESKTERNVSWELATCASVACAGWEDCIYLFEFVKLFLSENWLRRWAGFGRRRRYLRSLQRRRDPMQSDRRYVHRRRHPRYVSVVVRFAIEHRSCAGYQKIVVVPVGSRNVLLEELAPSRNALAVSDITEKRFFLNGNK